MLTREVPRHEWARFFDEFSRRYRGWLVNVDIFGALGAQVEAHERALKGVVVEERDGSPVIEILTGGDPDETLTHTVARPTRVQVEETREGAEAAVQIESRDEGRTLIRFRAAALPETVDGLPGN
jgi:hypothetical protein